MASVTREKDANNSELVFGDGLPFGHEVVQALGLYDRRLRNERVSEELVRLGVAVREIYFSEDEEKKANVKNINHVFRNETIAVDCRNAPPGAVFDNIMSWLARAKRDELQEFCEWNVQLHCKTQAKLDKASDLLRADTLERTNKLVEVDYFPRYANPIMEQTVDKVGRLHAIDSFEAGGESADGYFSLEKGDKTRLALRNLFALELVPSNMLRTTLHEYLHAAGMLNDAGFLSGILAGKSSSDEATHSWLEEAFVTHASQVAMHERSSYPEVILPSDRKVPRFMSDKGPYVKEREFLHMLVNRGPAKISPELLPQAFFVPNKDEVEYPRARAAFQENLKRNAEYFFPDQGDGALAIFSEAYERTKLIHRSKLLGGALRIMRSQLGIEDFYEDEIPSAGLDVLVVGE